MLLTRMGKFSKIIFLGSLNQIDLKGKTKENNDFYISFRILKDLETKEEIDLLGDVELVKSERSEFCSLIDDAFLEYKEKH